MNDQKQDNPYEMISSNHALYSKIFQKGEQSYVRLWVDYPDNDLLLTFGPMNKPQAQELSLLFKGTYCQIWEKWEEPFEEVGSPNVVIERKKEVYEENEARRNLPHLTNLQRLVYQVFREIDLLERELSQREYQKDAQHEPTYSQLYGAKQAVQALKDLRVVLTRYWSKPELTAWLRQKYDEWKHALEWSREAAANPSGKHLSEVGGWQAEGAFPVYEQWVPVIEWLASSERTTLSQHREMRKL